MTDTDNEKAVPRREPLVLLLLTSAILVWSGIAPHDRYTWWLEVAPVIAGASILIATRRRFPLTPLLYRLLFLHAAVLMVGGHYTYARVPVGFRVQEMFGWARNHYDRLGHFAQGFVPSMLARELLRRRTPLSSGGWPFLLSTCVALAFSAFYELIEWWTAAASGTAADDFLGTQGDVWDTQWDMFLALVGAVTAQLTLSRLHEKQLARLPR